MNEKDLVVNWAGKINLSENKEKETQKVLNELEYLVGSNRITIQERREMLEELFKILSLPPRLKNGQFLLLEQFENKHYLEMIKSILLFMDTKKDKKEQK